MGLFVTTITVDSLLTCSLISVQWCGCKGRNAGVCRSLISFRGRTRFPLFLMLSLSFKSNYDGITVLKQSANRALILEKDLVLRSSCRVPNFLKAKPSYCSELYSIHPCYMVLGQ